MTFFTRQETDASRTGRAFIGQLIANHDPAEAKRLFVAFTIAEWWRRSIPARVPHVVRDPFRADAAASGQSA
jgi:hypothetical protein